MLTKMPKVGDVLIANENARKMGGMKVGGEYVIDRVIGSGEARFIDNNGNRRFIHGDRFEFFTLKADAITEAQPDEPVGLVLIHGQSTYDSRTFELNVTVDIGGFNSIRNLARQSGKQSLRNSIQTKIDALQKELDAI